MIVNLSGECGRYYHGEYPQLVSMEGDNLLDVIGALNLDATDRKILSKGYVTPAEEAYLDAKHPNHPELMGGFWGSLTKTLKKIPVVGTAISVGEGIADVVKGSKSSKVTPDQTALLQQQLALQQQQQEKNKQMLMLIGIPAGLLLLMMVLQQRRN